MENSRASNIPLVTQTQYRIYAFTKGLCIVALVTSVWLVAVTVPISLFSLELIGSQVGVYAMIARFAWLCRKHFAASNIVLLMTILATGLGASMMYFLLGLIISASLAGPVAILVVFPVYGQMVVGILGCYFGYAAVEYKTRSAYLKHSTSIRGKLLVISVAALAVGFAASLWAFAARP